MLDRMILTVQLWSLEIEDLVLMASVVAAFLIFYYADVALQIALMHPVIVFVLVGGQPPAL